MSSSKAGTDTDGPSIDVDPFKLNKLALRVEEHLKKCAVNPDPKHLDPSAVLVAEQFIEQPQLVALCRKPESLQSLETHIRSINQKYMPILEPLLGSQQARLAVSDYINLVVRCILCKPWPKDIKITLPVGKYSDEKVLELGGCWAQTVDLKHPHVSFAEKAGLIKFLNDEQKELDSQEVNLEGCRKLRRDLSGGPDPSTGPKFKKGDKVTVVKK